MLSIHQTLNALRSTFGIFLLLLSGAAHAEEMAQLLFPQAGQRGTVVELTLLGEFLETPEEILFYQKGLRTVSIEPLTEVPNFRGNNPDTREPGTALKIRLAIAKDAPLGRHLLRLRSRDNLSEAVRFHVTPLPTVEEINPFNISGQPLNDTSETAQETPLNSTVLGYIPAGPAQDEDWYKVSLKKGQRLTAEALAARLGTHHRAGMNDAALSIFGPDGKELARDDDNSLHAQDPIVSIIAPTDGTYRILMRQQMDYETIMRHYALHIGDFPRPMVTFPLGGQAGTKLTFETLGRALPSKPVSLQLPADPGPHEASRIPWFAAPNSPSPNYLQVANFPDHLEASPPSSEQSPQVIKASLPFALNGRIESEGEHDWFRITAKAGEKYRVRVYAATLGSELDPQILLKAAPGNESKLTYEEDDSQWEAHDMIGNSRRWQIRDRLDPIFIFEPDQDGDYLLAISDKRRESSPSHIYRIEFQPHHNGTYPYFAAYPARPHTCRDRIVIYRGHSSSRPVSMMKGFGSTYSGQLQLRAIGLPKGVTMEAPEFSASAPSIPILFHAEKDSTPLAKTIELIAEPVDPKDRSAFRSTFVQNLPGTNRRGDYVMQLSPTRQMALAVVEGATFELTTEQPAIGLVQNGELKLQLHVKRHAGFDGAIYCEADWLPTGVSKQPPLIIPAGQDSADYLLTAQSNAPTGTFPISITARENEGGNVTYGGGYHFVSTPFIQLQITAPYLEVKLERTAIERGKKGSITASIKHLKPFEGSASLKLGRLPTGAKLIAPFPQIKAGDTDATFHIEITNDCLVNQYKEIFCEIILTDSGQTIRQQSGNGVLRVDPSRN